MEDFLVEKIGSCVVIVIRKEDKITEDTITSMNRALDKAESYEDATSLVTKGEEGGGSYSLGVDLQWMAERTLSELMDFGRKSQKLCSRILTFPLVTIAAINGNVFGSAALFAISHDHVIMRTGKGRLSFPEVRNNLNFPVGYLNLLRAKVPHAEQHQAIVLGKRYTAEEALSSKVVQEICTVEELKDKAIAAGHRFAGQDGLDRKVLSSIKYDLYRDTYRSLMDPVHFHSSL